MKDKLIPLTLEQHQQVLYEILYMVDDFCKAHEIPYFLVGGTLLGAARHQAMIPWDDDVDIAMTRENYDRFAELFHAEGVEGYELFDCKHNAGYLYPFAKMTKKDTWTTDSQTHRINIDVFAYDGCGDNADEAIPYFKEIRYNTQKFAWLFIFKWPFKKNYFSPKDRFQYMVKKFPKDLIQYYPMLFFGKLRNYYLNRMFQKYIRYSITEKKYCANIMWGKYGLGELQPSSSFLILDTMLFGTRQLPVPSGWHDYLTGLYGNYMELPPENERRMHSKEASCLIVHQSSTQR